MKKTKSKSKKISKPYGKLILISIGLISAGFLFLSAFPEVEPVETTMPERREEEKRKEEKDEVIRLAFVGDIMLNRGVLFRAENENDPALPFRKIKDRLHEPDIMFGNLESMISDQGFDQGGEFSFRAPPKMMEGLILADFDVMSIANNHSFDWGVDALTDTEKRLEKEGIVPVGGGLDAYEPKIIEKNGQSFAFIAHTGLGASGWVPTDNTPGVALYDEAELRRSIEKVKGKVDAVIFSIHYGIEYETKPSQNQIDISKNAIDMGADLVIGHHPHVIQPVEEYEGGIIAYSLGNFVFDQDFSEETMEGLLLEVDFKEGEIVNFEKEVVPMNQNFQPHIDN